MLGPRGVQEGVDLFHPGGQESCSTRQAGVGKVVCGPEAGDDGVSRVQAGCPDGGPAGGVIQQQGGGGQAGEVVDQRLAGRAVDGHRCSFSL